MRASILLAVTILFAPAGSTLGGAESRATGQAAPQLTAPESRPRVFEAPIGPGTKPVLAYSPKWAAYGPYLQRMIDGIHGRWVNRMITANTAPESPARVVVRFVLNDAGMVMSTAVVESNASAATNLLCEMSINPDPLKFGYGAWTPEMVAALGKSQELTFTFVNK